MLAHNLPRVFADGGDVSARQAVQLGAAWAGLAIENSMLGAAHALANPLTAVHHVVHGQAVGLMLPHVVRFNAAVCPDLCADLLRAIGIESRSATAGEQLAQWLAMLLRAAGLAESLTALDIATPDIGTLAQSAANQWTAGFNPRPVAAADLARLYEAAR